MVDPLSEPTDVRVEINTRLDDPEISAILRRVARDNDRVNGAAAMDDARRTDLEAALAAYHIATQRDRSVRQKTLGSGSKSYEVNVTDRLRDRIRTLDPSDGAVIDPSNQWTVTTRDVTDGW